MEEPTGIQEDKGEYYAELFSKEETETRDLFLFLDWLKLGENEEEVSSFIALDGLSILAMHLEEAERHSRKTGDFNKQVLVLKVMSELFKYDDVRSQIPSLQDVVNAVIGSVHLVHVEVSTIVLDLLTNISWISEAGYQIVVTAMLYLQETQNYNYKFEPFIRILEEARSVVLLKNVCTFINTIVEAPKDQNDRLDLKEDLVVHGITVVYGDIKMKVREGYYKAEECSYEFTMKEIGKRKFGQGQGYK